MLSSPEQPRPRRNVIPSMRRRSPRLSIIAALALSGGAILSLATPASAQVWEPGDPPREGYDTGSGTAPLTIPAPEEPGADSSLQVPDAPPDAAGAMTPIANPEESPAWAEDAEETQPRGTPLSPRREAPTAAPQETPATAPSPASSPAPSPAPSTAPAQAAAEDPDDFLCSRAPAGKTTPVPPPFNQWLVRVCSPRGQALVPVFGEAWVAHNSADPVSVLAMPPGAVPPPSLGAFDPRYDIRFETFEGGKAEGERHAQAAGLIETASGAEKVPAYDEIWQLDAVSNVAGARYNLFFFVADNRPHRIIACLDQCRQALYLDVLKGEEAKEVLGR